MKINKYKIEELRDKLDELLCEMENADIDEVATTSNTYGLYKFISFGVNGYLDLDKDIHDLIKGDDEDE